MSDDRLEERDELAVERRSRASLEASGDRVGADQTRQADPPTGASRPDAGEDAFPDRIRRKYYVVPPETDWGAGAGETRIYADERGEYLAFKATEDRLSTRLDSVDVVRDMISVAQHRRWEALHVRGAAEFRREAWLEASARGIEVTGYEPTELDRQVVAKRAEGRQNGRASGIEAAAEPAASSPKPERVDYERGVSGRLLEAGAAPYRNRADAEPSAYVKLELDNGRQHRLWGVGLEKAVADSKAQAGDRVHVRRDGLDHVTKDIKVIDTATGKSRIERRDVARNRWHITAEKFRSADRETVARDPELAGALSQIAVLERALDKATPDRGTRESMLRVARERIAQHLDHGHTFRRAMVSEQVLERTVPDANKISVRDRPQELDRKRDKDR